MTDQYAPDPALPWASRVLLRVEVGSTAHGTGIPDQEDYDELAVMAEPWENSIGIRRAAPEADEHTIVYRPGREPTDTEPAKPSQPGDYDLVAYTARRFAYLASQGNPNILMLLFGPVTFTTPLGDSLRELAPAFWSDFARERFLGYANAQRERLMGIRGGRHVNRDDPHGFDSKYAMHTVRLGIQGVEFIRTGRLVLPIPDPFGELLRSIRRGEHSLEAINLMAAENERILTELAGVAPPEPDFDRINDWLLDVHRSALPLGAML